ncbi:MAG: Gfo/Idh/MocA family oxidoreductase [Dehalococcoidales bacterium]
MKTKIAIVGLGKMGLMHASIMGMMNDVEITAICEKNGLIRRFGEKVIPHIKILENLDGFRGMGLDAILITTPPASHYPIIKTIYEKVVARHVFTEKPLAINYQQAKELIGLAEKNGGVNMVGYQRRFSVTFKKAKQILESGDIGNPISFQGHAYSADFLGAKTTKQAIGRGGVIEDSGCHVIDIALWMLGDMKPIKASVKSLLGSGSEDEASILVITNKGIKGELNSSWCKEGYRLPDICLSITAEKGILTVNEDRVQLELNDGKSTVWYKHDLNDTVPFFIGGSEYQRQGEMFIRAIREGQKAYPDFLTAAKVNQLVDAANQLAKGAAQ